jgi:hypothetical protein
VARPADLEAFSRARDVFASLRDPAGGTYDNGSLSSNTNMSSVKTSLYWFAEKWESYRANALFSEQPKFKVLRHYMSSGRFVALDAIPRRVDESMVALCEGEGAKSQMEICNSYLDAVLKRVSACDTETRTARPRLGAKP